MKRISVATWFFVLLSVTALAEPPKVQTDAVTIPLDRVSGHGRHGLRELEPDLFVYRDTPEKWEKYSTLKGSREAQETAKKSLAIPIEHAMAKMRPSKDGVVGQGFAVRGEGRDSLQGVYSVLVRDERPDDRFLVGTKLSVVFFAVPSLPVCLDSIERSDNKVTIRYMLLPQGSTYLPWHLSLIPLGELPSGQYQVEMIRSVDKERELIPPGLPAMAPDAERQIVCRSFRFTVFSEPAN